MFRLLIVALVTVTFPPVSLQANAISAESARDLYVRARTKERHSPALSYETVQQTDAKTITAKFYTAHGPDGVTLLRIERLSKLSRTTYLNVDVSNATGYWTIIE